VISPISHRASLTPVVVFALVFLVCAVFTVLGQRVLPGLADRMPNITQADPPPNDEGYLAADRGGHIDHHVHYFGLDGKAIDALRRADVLFLGNSRLMFALRPGVLDPFFESLGLRYYVMGFGFREGDQFPLEILRRFDIRPRLVVVNADGFFGRDVSEWAAEVMGDTRFEAVKLQWENEVAHDVRRAAHRVVPHWFDFFERPGLPDDGDEFIAYRSRENGTWQVSPWPSGQDAVPLGVPAGEAADWMLDAARAFKTELEQRGSRLVLTFVPTPSPDTREVADVAEELDIPLAVPLISGLTTHDDSHLTEDSATLWTERFLRVLAPYLPSR
jgi:hypothetical protein